jgi:GNAT superfamily N-acetyltransferase
MSSNLASADRALAQRIEAVDAAVASSFIQDVEPHAMQKAAGGYCLFGGLGSPLTHAVGIGMSGPVDEAELDRIEEFYHSRGASCAIDLCPLADDGLIRMIQSRGYRVTELNNVLARRIGPGDRFPVHASIRRISPAKEEAWSRVVLCGFADSDEPVPGMAEALTSSSPEFHPFAATEEEAFVAGAAVGIRAGVAWCVGDATLPRARGRGWQQALIAARLRLAQASGCDLAGTAVLPGTSSHRNYLRAGFELIYMRVCIARDPPQ